MLLKPIRKINTDLITAEGKNIQRIMLSLALKTTTQNIIVGKLSAFRPQHCNRWNEIHPVEIVSPPAKDKYGNILTHGQVNQG